MKHPQAYQGKKVVVLGMAKSGTAVAKLFRSYGAEVVVNDAKARAACAEADELEALGVTVICGHHPTDLLAGEVALIVKNPGIPYSIGPLVEAAQKGIETVTEVEVAFHVCRTKNIIGITGSNGKTTTTSWVGEVLRAAGWPTVVAGNIGRALSDAAPGLQPDDWLVAELSSFQLLGTVEFAPRIAVLLNFAETHLDYHGTMEHYVAAKARLFASQTATEIAVLNWDDACVRALAPNIRARIVPFSMREPLETGLFLRNERLVWRTSAAEAGAEAGQTVPAPMEIDLLGAAELGIPGRHNVENALAVCAATLAAGVDADVLRNVLRTFRGVEHRLEWVAEKHGVRYYNDSKATNPQATTKAIDGFAGQVILIAGGLDRGSDYMELTDMFRAKLKALITLGETADKIVRVGQQAGLAYCESVGTHDDAAAAVRAAVERAATLAAPGDTVLLSPACASWDMFPSYEVRGRIFKECVHNLI